MVLGAVKGRAQAVSSLDGLVARIGRWRREVDGIGGRPRS
jgi:hypothetical protein